MSAKYYSWLHGSPKEVASLTLEVTVQLQRLEDGNRNRKNHDVEESLEAAVDHCQFRATTDNFEVLILGIMRMPDRDRRILAQKFGLEFYILALNVRMYLALIICTHNNIANCESDNRTNRRV